LNQRNIYLHIHLLLLLLLLLHLLLLLQHSQIRLTGLFRFRINFYNYES
jgi:hypothetical protein